MLLFGVTGGIGSGKSTVCDFLRKKGIVIIAADPLAKELTNTLPEIRQELTAEFGPEVYTETGELNKSYLSKLVFADTSTRQRVNRIIHPHVRSRIRNEAKRLAQEGRELIGVEAALIFESKMEEILDAVIVVSAPHEHRIAWLEKRDNLAEKEIEQRMQAQMPMPEKLRRADYIIDNSGDLHHLSLEVDKAYDWLCSEARS